MRSVQVCVGPFICNHVLKIPSIAPCYPVWGFQFLTLSLGSQKDQYARKLHFLNIRINEGLEFRVSQSTPGGNHLGVILFESSYSSKGSFEIMT